MRTVNRLRPTLDDPMVEQLLLRGEYAFEDPVGNVPTVVRRCSECGRPNSNTRDMLSNLASLAFRDGLTGLCNRRGFLSVGQLFLQAAVQSRRKVTLFYGDVDHLKRINDCAGHSAGDALLLRMGQVLRASFRRTDILGRLGGDEFAALTIVGRSGGEQVIAARLQNTLKRANKMPGADPLEFSFGFATFDPKRPVSMEALLEQADQNMYSSKRAKYAAPTLVSGKLCASPR